ncbi:MAG: ferredoxin-thioredoxin reductase catalytic domain-containing protein [Candidatus Aminicenantes bacterium]
MDKPADTDYQRSVARLEKVAAKKGYVFNPNADWVKQVIRLMTDNRIETGEYYCPCKQHHPPDPENDVTCPCPTSDEEVERDGYCHCRLFFKKGFEKKKFNILDTITCPG